MRKRITKTAIAAIKPPAKGKVFLNDTELTGFCVCTYASGKQSYVLRYRTNGGVQRKVTINECAAMYPDDARDMARDMLKRVKVGQPPIAPRRDMTVSDMRERFDKTHAVRLKPNTQINYRAAWNNTIIPAIGHMRVDEVGRMDVMDMHYAHADQPYRANRSVRVLRKAFVEAAEWGWIKLGENPAANIKMYPEYERDRVLDDGEIARLWAVASKPEYSDPNPVGLLVKLLLVTGCRLSEWLYARVEHLNLDRGILTLPDSKTGKRYVWLSDMAVALLRDRSYWSPYVLPGLTGAPMANVQRNWRQLRAEAGLDDVRLHDLRHTVGSISHDVVGLSQKQVGAILGHRNMKSTERYINSTDASRRQASSQWGGHLQQIIDVKARED